MAATMQQFLVLAQHDLDNIAHEAEEAYPPQYAKVFNVESLGELYKIDAKMAGFGPFQNIAEGGSVTYDEPIAPVTRRYDIVKRGSGYVVTDKLWMNDRYGEVKKFEQDLIAADVDDTDTFFFALLNNATATTISTGFDGLALASTAHTRLDGGATQSNSLSTALSLSALEDAVIAFTKLRQDRGRPYMSKPKTLLIPLDLVLVAEEILGSTLRPDTTNNATNAIRMFNLDVLALPYITSTTFAALVGSKHDINAIWRQKSKTDSEVDFDTDSIKRKRTKWMSRGHGEWRGYMQINT